MFRRGVGLVAALACAAVLLSGCDGSPGPSPSTSAPLFASEAEAFAAAEATYRAYVDAGNEIDLKDPTTFEPVLALTAGEVNSDERKNLSKMAAEGWMVSGDTAVIWFEGTAWIPEDYEVLSRACIDVSAIEVVDSRGVSQVQPDRRDQYAIDLTFIGAADALHGLRIESSVAVEDDRCSAE